MFKERPSSVIAIAAFVITVIACIWWFLFPGGKARHIENVQKKNIQETKQKKSEGTESGGRPEEETKKISIEDLDHFYSSDVGSIPSIWDCKHKRALLEFLFVKKSNEKYEPVRISAIDTRMVFEKSSEKVTEKTDCPYRYARADDNAYIYYMNIAKHCNNCTVNALITGKTYKLVQIGKHEDLNYTFEVPPAEKLEFRHEFDRDEIKGTKDDPVHRIPVVVEEALKTKKEPKSTIDPTKPVPEKTLTVKGVPELADNEQLLVHYMLGGTDQVPSEKVGEGTWKVTIRKRGMTSKTGGLLALYRVFSSEQRNTDTFLTLLGYVPEVTEDPVKLSNCDYRNYQQKSWHTEQIRLNPYLSEERIEKWRKMDPQVITGGKKAVVLSVRGTDTEEPVYVSASIPTIKNNDQFYVTLTAPAGVYKLMVDNTVIQSSFRWPPDNE